MTYPRPSTGWGVVGRCMGVCRELVSVKYHHLHTLLHTTHVAEIDSTSLYSNRSLPAARCRAIQLYTAVEALQLYSYTAYTLYITLHPASVTLTRVSISVYICLRPGLVNHKEDRLSGGLVFVKTKNFCTDTARASPWSH